MGKVLRRWVLLALLVTLTAGLGPAAVSAQDGSDGGEDAPLDVSQFAGIEAAVARGYVASITQEPVSGQLLTMSVMVLRFDSDRHAHDALDPVVGLLRDGLMEGGIALTEATIDDGDVPGDEAVRYVVDSAATPGAAATPDPDDELLAGLELLAVRSGDTVVLVLGLPLEGKAGPALLAVAEAVLGRDAGTGAMTLDADGASTGGLFDRLPTEGDPVLAGTSPVSDMVLFPVEDGQ